MCRRGSQGSPPSARDWHGDDLAARLPLGEFAACVCPQPGGELYLVRSLSGGERLYFTRDGHRVTFATSLRPLLALSAAPRFDARHRRDIAMAGLPLFGDGSLVAGIREVLPGHVACFNGSGVEQHFYCRSVVVPPRADPARLAARFRQALTDSVALAIGRRRPVAVALSGGIDSAAVINAAVDLVGADQVVAFTQVFDDPTHSDETAYAHAVCARLGIRDHRVFRVGLADFIRAIPETVWRAESHLHWPKAFLLPFSRHIRDAGFDQYLTGFGVGSHLAHIDDIASLLRRVPAALLFRLWRLAHFHGWRWLDAGEALHPGLAMPNRRLYFLVLATLHAAGKLDTMAPYYPKDYAPLLDAHAHEPPQTQGDTAEVIRTQGLTHLASCIDVTRWEKPLREIGACRVSPAHWLSCLPYAYVPYAPRPAAWRRARRLRPGKELLRLGFADSLPQTVLYRQKSWADAVISPTWYRAGIHWMSRVASAADHLMAPFDPAAVADWDRRSPQAALTALRFWHRIFIEQPPRNAPPTWESLHEPTH
jgi:hypothetical protein